MLSDAPARLTTAQITVPVPVPVLDISLNDALVSVPHSLPLTVGSTCRLQLG